jgi:Asp-tRNA(Asn)/Glu-tRNA(Gln) amidotransferase A subunit family amidase
MKEITQEFYEIVWDKYHFDAIIAPGMACPALPHGATTTLSPLANGTFYYNLIDSPVGAIPVTRVTPEDIITEEWRAASDVPKGDTNPNGGSWILNDGVYGRNGRGGVYDPVKMAGLPVGQCVLSLIDRASSDSFKSGIQVVGRKWEDEKVLAIMSVVDKALGPRGFGPGAWKPKA